MALPIGFPRAISWEAKRFNIWVKLLISLGERGGTRTLDPMIKRKVFKAFSIMISTKAVDNLWAILCSNEP
jgi:hypothetical protein